MDDELKTKIEAGVEYIVGSLLHHMGIDYQVGDIIKFEEKMLHVAESLFSNGVIRACPAPAQPKTESQIGVPADAPPIADAPLEHGQDGGLGMELLGN